MAAKPYLFAYGTKVETAQTRGEIEALLKREGATSFMYGQQPGAAVVQFFLRERLIRFRLKLPDEAKQPAELRRRWRALLLVLKAKLESIRDDTVETFEEAFLAHTVTPDGTTVAEAMLTQIADAYKTGRQPAMTLALPAPPTQGGSYRG